MINVKFINNTLHLVYLYLCIRKLCLFTAGADVSVTRFRYNVCFTVSKRNRLRLGWSAAVRAKAKLHSSLLFPMVVSIHSTCSEHLGSQCLERQCDSGLDLADPTRDRPSPRDVHSDR